MTEEFKKKFLTHSDHTGRQIVYSVRTGKSYYIEPIENYKHKIEPIHDAGYIGNGWGDLNPSTGKLEGSYGKKYKGSIKNDESLITEENGFSKIVVLSPGYSPYAEIERRDVMYPTLEKTV
jgi:hypothetical protein